MKTPVVESGANVFVIKPDLDDLLGSIMQFVSHTECVEARPGNPLLAHRICAAVILQFESNPSVP